MSFKSVLELEKLKQENRHVLVVEGKKILLIWHNDKVHAIQSQCPHLKLPLTKGKITENDTIVCPFHHSEFDLCTGKTQCWSSWPPVVGPLLGKVSQEKDLKVYPTQIQDGQIYVDIE